MIPNVARDAASTKEDNLYWVVLIDGGSKSQFTENQGRCFGVVPPIMRGLVAGSVRKGIRKALVAQGMGRHSRNEIYEIGKADLTAASMWLGDEPFFMGATATSVDASAYSFLVSILVPEILAADHGTYLANLWAYCGLMKKKYYET